MTDADTRLRLLQDAVLDESERAEEKNRVKVANRLRAMHEASLRPEQRLPADGGICSAVPPSGELMLLAACARMSKHAAHPWRGRPNYPWRWCDGRNADGTAPYDPASDLPRQTVNDTVQRLRDHLGADAEASTSTVLLMALDRLEDLPAGTERLVKASLLDQAIHDLDKVERERDALIGRPYTGPISLVRNVNDQTQRELEKWMDRCTAVERHLARVVGERDALQAIIDELP